MENKKLIQNGTITTPAGFKAGAVNCWIKNTEKKDLAIILSDAVCNSAGVYTRNKVRSRTIDITKNNIDKKNIRAVVVNSGNANCSVGEQGYKDAERMTLLAAENLRIDPGELGVASTGVIGVPLPMDRIEKGISEVATKLTNDGGLSVAEAIMTTDTKLKSCAIEVELTNGTKGTIGAIAKGSGMISPNMGTMLGFITTDFSIDKKALQEMLTENTEKTFNMISVDTDTSTNDMVLMLANGKAGNKMIETHGDDFEKIKLALYDVMEYLAKMIARDGEGATKLIEVSVLNCRKIEDAKNIGKSVVNSPLVKTAIFGEDPNWGRIIMAVGKTDADIIEEKIDLFIGGIKICENGIGIMNDETIVKKELEKNEVKIVINLKNGEFAGKVWGCDLSYDYIKINADYRS